MIRINLLEETRVAGKARGAGFALPQFKVGENVPTIVLAVGVGAAVLVVAIWWMTMRAQINSLDQQIRTAEQERARLEHVLKRVEELSARKADIDRKIQIITDLRKRQDAPVRLLDQLSDAVPEQVWLQELTYTGDTVSIRGQTHTPFAYSEFLQNLEESPYFSDVASGRYQQDGTRVWTFQMETRFTPPGLGPPPVQVDPDARGGAAARRRR